MEGRARKGSSGSDADRLVSGFEVREDKNRVMKIFASAAGLMVASHMTWEKRRKKQVWWEKIKRSVSAVLVRGSTRRSRGQVSGGGKRRRRSRRGRGAALGPRSAVGISRPVWI